MIENSYDINRLRYWDYIGHEDNRPEEKKVDYETRQARGWTRWDASYEVEQGVG